MCRSHPHRFTLQEAVIHLKEAYKGPFKWPFKVNMTKNRGQEQRDTQELMQLREEREVVWGGREGAAVSVALNGTEATSPFL